jgi:hypothetical protein
MKEKEKERRRRLAKRRHRQKKEKEETDEGAAKRRRGARAEEMKGKEGRETRTKRSAAAMSEASRFDCCSDDRNASDPGGLVHRGDDAEATASSEEAQHWGMGRGGAAMLKKARLCAAQTTIGTTADKYHAVHKTHQTLGR